MIGIIVWLCVEFSLWPRRACDVALSVTADAVSVLSNAMSAHADECDDFARILADQTSDEAQQKSSSTSVDKALALVKAKVSLARRLIVAAQQEPELWRAPFPHACVIFCINFLLT